MEKIYMNETKKQKKQKRGIVNFSVVLSFVVAIFAIFSLTMFGIVSNQDSEVSYAAPSDNFTLAEVSNRVVAYGDESRSVWMQVPAYFVGSDSPANRIFCIERNKETQPGDTYSKTITPRSDVADVKDDAGLLYLLGLGETVDSRKVTMYDDDNVNSFVIQSAIWLYLAEKYPNDDVYKLRKNTTAPNNIDDLAVLNVDTVYLSFNGDTSNLRGYDDLTGSNGVIRKLVNEAKTMTAPRITVTKAGGEIAKTDDGKYYQSSLITVNASGSLSGYDISLSGIDGAIAVDENGNELALTNVAAGKKFYVRVPVDKVTETVQNLHIVVNGHFASTSGVYYATSDANLQRLMSVTSGDVSGGLDLEFVGAPNTGMNTAQTIYFIGLIVLLCGVGIVYANAKPVESKQ